MSIKRLVGEDCPLLFDKWKPMEFTDFLYDIEFDTNHMVELHYDFDFGLVVIRSDKINNSPLHLISAHQKLLPRDNIDDLFEPNILEMYKDAKKFVVRILKDMSVRFSEIGLVDINKYSAFGRVTGFQTSVDYDKLPGCFENVEERNKVAQEVYTSLEEHLRNKFGIVSEEVRPLYLLHLRTGNQKILNFSNGISLTTENPLPDEINAGTLYMRLVSNEESEKEFYADIFNSCLCHLNGKLKNKLQPNSYRKEEVVSIGLSGDGSQWRIDLSNVIPPKICAGIFAGYLTKVNRILKENYLK